MKSTMKCFVMSVVILILVVTTCRAAAGEDASQTIPKIVLAGLDAYKANGADAAIKAWLKGNPLEGDKQAASQVAGQVALFEQVESFYGSYKSYELVQTKDISKSTKLVYLVINFQRGPLFVRFVCYKAEPDWIIPIFDFNTKPELVFPSLMLPESK